MPCSNPIGLFRGPEGQAIPAPCKSWSCPDCAKVKKNQVLDRAQAGYQEVQAKGGRVRALCLTLGPKAENSEMGKYFARFRAWLAKPRKHRKKFRSYRHINYFWTKEFQENGQLHLHLLIDAYIPVALIRKAWKWATRGTSKIVFITAMNREIYHPAGYMTKYMTKEIAQNGKFRRKERRFGFSRGLFKLAPKQPTGWTFELGARIIIEPSIKDIAFNLKAASAPALADPNG